MEGIETVLTETVADPAPAVELETEAASAGVSMEVDDGEVQKKRKENPVPEEEAMKEANGGRPVRAKYARYAHTVTPKSVDSDPDEEYTEELKSKREEDKRKRAEEREAKRLAIEEAKRQKEAEKLKKEEEKKQKEEAKEAEKQRKEAEKQRKEAEKIKKEEEKAAKEEERRKAKELAEIEKAAKEEERKRAKELKEEEKRKKEEEKRQKEGDKQKAVSAKQRTVEKAQEAAKRQSSMLMSFVKITPSNTPNTSLMGEDKPSRETPSKASNARFQKVGPFLAWVPPQGAIVPTFQKWTNRASPDEFQKAVSGDLEGFSEEKLRSLFEAWRINRKPLATHSELVERRRSQYQHRPEFNVECAPRIEKQKKHMLEHRTKFLQIDESWRPPFYGTFSRSSPQVTGRKWNGKASGIDYELDSADESFGSLGEAEEDADDLEGASRGSDDEEEENEANEYEFDAFLVPDGHLSDEEARGEDEELGDAQAEPAERKERAALLAQTKRRLDTATAPPVGQLAPQLTPLVLHLDRLDPAQNVDVKSSALLEAFQAHTMRVLVTPLPLNVESQATGAGTLAPVTVRKSGAKPIPQEVLPQLAAFIHKQFLPSFERLLDLVHAEFNQASKKQFGRYIREKCEKMKPTTAKGAVWLVKRAHRAELGLPAADPEPPTPPATVPLPFAPARDPTSQPSSATNTPQKKVKKGRTTAPTETESEGNPSAASASAMDTDPSPVHT